MKKREEKPEERDQRRPYEAPEVRTEEVFETMALTCAKGEGQCNVNPGIPAARS